MMSEFSAIHVEGNRAFYGLALGQQIKARALINELPDYQAKPAGRYEGCVGSPATTLVVRQIEGSDFCDRASGFLRPDRAQHELLLTTLVSREAG